MGAGADSKVSPLSKIDDFEDGRRTAFDRAEVKSNLSILTPNGAAKELSKLKAERRSLAGSEVESISSSTKHSVFSK